MKKALAILMVLALVGTAAFAEITIGGFGRGMFVVSSDGNETYTSAETSWGATPRFGMSFAGKSDNVGFIIDINSDGGATPGLGDNQQIWVKPIEMVTVRIGNIYDDTLRGNATFGTWDWLRGYGPNVGEDAIFTRLGTKRSNATDNFEISVKPVDAFFAAVYFSGIGTPGAEDLSENLFDDVQIAAGYTIDGIGQAKAQLIRYTAGLEVGNTIEIAFDYTGMENLFVSASFKMETNDVVDPTKAKNINLYGKYTMDALTLHLANYDSIVDVVGETEVFYTIVAGADYALDGGIGISGEVSYAGTTADGVDGTFTVFGGVNKGFSNGGIGAGVEVMNDGTDTTWAIPVRLQYFF